jgi:hypothetical protein
MYLEDGATGTEFNLRTRRDRILKPLIGTSD